MNITKDELVEIIQTTVAETVKALKSELDIGSAKSKTDFNNRSAYQKTEQLLYMYPKFKRILEEADEKIWEYQHYGVPQRCGALGERVQGGSVPSGIVLPEESVDTAVHNIEKSMETTKQLVDMIESGLNKLHDDNYIGILDMIYFQGITQESVALEYNTTQKTISKNKSRLVRELALDLFPDQVISELIN